ncbi:MAG: AGE family epimerase/isomerase [Chitinispirillaceae bacterium]|nr:AGE family epimerase/isomerase [Chitinispirillaceae bacterium]
MVLRRVSYLCGAIAIFVSIVSAQTELIKNGTFSSGTTNWNLGQYGGNSTTSFTGGEYCILVNTAGSEHWHVQFTQSALPLVQGKIYTFSFDAYKGTQNSGTQTMQINVGQSNSPYTSYFGSQNQMVTLTTVKTRYSYTFTMSAASDNNSRIECNCGKSTGGFYFDNISLVETMTAQPMLSASPTLLNFGLTNVGSSRSLSIVLRNSGNATTTINSIESSTGLFSTALSTPVTVTSGGSLTVPILFAPQAQGAVSGELSIYSNASDNPVLTVTCVGEAVLPGLSINPLSINHCSVPNVPVSQTVTLGNSSSGSITWSATGSSGWISVAPSAGSVTAGNNATLTITLNGTYVGVYDGSIQLTHSAGNIASPVTIPVAFTVQNGYEPESPYIRNPELAIDFVKDIATFRMRQRDNTYGGFHTSIDRQGNSTGANEKALCGQSRVAYTFIRAFMLTGDEQYLEQAHHALKFLYDHGWNDGWYFITDAQGNHINHWGHDDWWSFQQHYALVGVTAMVEATGGTMNWNDGSENDQTWLMRGINSNYTKLWDSNQSTKGYFDHANTAWTNKWNKGFTPTVDGITTHALLMAMMYDSLNHQNRFVELADNVVDHLIRNMNSAAAGFPEVYDANWNVDNNNSSMDIGHGFKTAWVLQRAYLLRPDRREYLTAAQALMQNLWETGCYDSVNGAPYRYVNWKTGEITSKEKDFWMVEQGFTSGIMSYYTAQSQLFRDRYMKIADGSLNFFMDHLMDPVYGESYNIVSEDGVTVIDENKGGLFTAGYHSSELGYYAYLYSSLYYHGAPVELYYYYPSESYDRSFKLTPIAIEDEKLKILSVTLDGRPYTNFDSNTRHVNLPSGVGGKLKVTFGFTPAVTYSVIATAGNGGTISPSGTVTVNDGASVTFTMTPRNGYRIGDVTVDAVSAGAVSTYTLSSINADHTISATFQPVPVYTITAGAGAGGSITPSGSVSVAEGTSATFTITPSAGYDISDVTVDGQSVGVVSTYTFSNVTGNHSISASFSLRNFTITSTATDGGMISPLGAVSAVYGSSQTFTIIPQAGYRISSLVVDGVSVPSAATYTFSSVSSSHAISAGFTAVTSVVYQINCGSNSSAAPYSADRFGTGGTLRTVSNSISASGLTDPAPQGVYQNERYGNSTYTIPDLVPSAMYRVRLHFAELYWTAAGRRVFDVSINETTVLSNFDIYASAGSRYKAIIREFTATANSSGQIVIIFTTRTDNATIEGIEVIEAIPDNPPELVNPASATPAVVAGSTTALSVLGSDDNGESNLIYSWAATGTVPAPVTFSANTTNGAKNSVATFTGAGTYALQATIRDQANKTATSSVTVTVNQTPTLLSITPQSSSVTTNAEQLFSALLTDQFGNTMTPQTAIVWSVSGGGSISSGGNFTAGSSAGGSYTVTALCNNLSAAATVSVTSLPAAMYQINCGSSSGYTPFGGDQYGSGGTQRTVSNNITISGVTDPAPQNVYRSERYGNSTYTFPGLTPSMSYKVRFHFAELYWTASGRRVFNVQINNSSVLTNFDIFAAAGAQYRAVVREFTATANSSGQIVITFTTVTDNASIGGIEILR